jgi:quinolinate synthase
MVEAMADTLTVQNAPSFDETYRRLKAKLTGVVPDFELQLKAELAYKVNELKRERNAVILGHNYMEPALFYSVPDYTGDSLELSRKSTETSADIIVFCGVQFMAETAKILNPDKTVLIPSKKAGCSLASGITAEDVRKLRSLYPDAPVITYVNTYADVKAESDYCCTSGNAAKVLKHVFAEGAKRVIFLPDEYLGHNTAVEMGVGFVAAKASDTEPNPAVFAQERTVIGWSARCEVHELFTVEDVERARKQFPDVVILAHPECSPEVMAKVDVAGSTKQMLDYIKDMKSGRLLLLTECSMADNIAAENPHLELLRLCNLRCPHMAQITLEDTLEALEKVQYKIELPSDIVERARLPIERMLAIR